MAGRTLDECVAESGLAEVADTNEVAAYLVREQLPPFWERLGIRSDSLQGELTGKQWGHRVLSRRLENPPRPSMSKQVVTLEFIEFYLKNNIAEFFSDLPEAGEAGFNLEQVLADGVFVLWDLVTNAAALLEAVDGLEIEKPEGLNEEDPEALIDLLVEHQMATLRFLNHHSSEGGSRMDQSEAPSLPSSKEEPLLAEREGFATTGPSHPQGIAGWPVPLGCFREFYPYHEVETSPVQIPFRVRKLFGAIFLKLETKGGESFNQVAELYRVGLEVEFVLVPFTAVGISTESPLIHFVQTLELCAGGKSGSIGLEELMDAPRERSVEEAIKDYREEGAEVFVHWVHEKVDLDDMERIPVQENQAQIWGSTGTTLKATEAAKAPGAGGDGIGSKGVAKPDALKGVQTILGWSAEEIANAPLNEIQEALLELTKQASQAQVQSGKEGHRRALLPVDPESLARNVDPLSGEPLPESLSDEARAGLAARIGLPNPNARRSADTNPWCAMCNSPNMVKAAAASGLTQDSFLLTDFVKRSIVVARGDHEVNCHACNSFLNPPCLHPTACPRELCGHIFLPPTDQICLFCPKCKLNYVGGGEGQKTIHGLIGNDKKDLRHGSVTEMELERRWAYVKSSGGGNSLLDQCGLPSHTYQQAVTGLIKLQNNPSMLQGIDFPCTITAELVAHVILGITRSDGNYIELGAPRTPLERDELARTNKLTYEAVKKVWSGKAPPVPASDSTQVGAPNLTMTLLLFDSNVREAQAMIWGRNYLKDLPIAKEILRKEVNSLEREVYYDKNPQFTKNMLNSHHLCMDNRLSQTINQLHSPVLFFWELASGAIRNLPTMQSTEYIAAVPLALKKNMGQLLLVSVEKELTEKHPEQVKKPAGKDQKALTAAQDEIKKLKAELEAEKGKKAPHRAAGAADSPSSPPKGGKGGKGGGKGGKGGGKGKGCIRVVNGVTEYEIDGVWQAKPAPKTGKVQKEQDMPPLDESQEQTKSQEQVKSQGQIKAQERAKPPEIKMLSLKNITRPQLAVKGGDTRKLDYLIPRNQEGQKRCWMSHTHRDCPELAKKHHCPLAHHECPEHEALEAKYWPFKFVEVFLHYGGHSDWGGELSWDKVGNLVTPVEKALINKLPEGQAADALQAAMIRKLQEITGSRASPLDPSSLVRGEVSIVTHLLWDASTAPFQFGSPSGIPIDSVSMCAVGFRNALLLGNKWDMGEEIQLREGVKASNLCLIKTLAAAIAPWKEVQPNVAGREADALLLRQVVDSLSQVSCQPGSILAELFASACELESGLPLDLLRICNPKALEDCSVLTITGVSPENAGDNLTFALNVNDELGGKRQEVYGPSPGHLRGSVLKKRKFGEAAVRSRLLVVVVTEDPAAKARGDEVFSHAEYLDVGGGFSLLNMTKELSRMVEAEGVKVIITPRGTNTARAKLDKAEQEHPSAVPTDEESLEEARGKLSSFKAKMSPPPTEAPAPQAKREQSPTKAFKAKTSPPPTEAPAPQAKRKQSPTKAGTILLPVRRQPVTTSGPQDAPRPLAPPPIGRSERGAREDLAATVSALDTSEKVGGEAPEKTLSEAPSSTSQRSLGQSTLSGKKRTKLEIVETNSAAEPSPTRDYAPPPTPPPAFEEEWREGLVKEANEFYEKTVQELPWIGATGPGSPKQWAETWKIGFLPELNKKEFISQERSLARTLTFAGQFFNRWLKDAHEQRHLGKPKNALQEIQQALRDELLGGQASDLPRCEDILDKFSPSMTKEHQKLLEKLVKEGHDPLYLDVRRGKGRHAPQNDKLDPVLRELLEDQASELLAYRALVFCSSDPEISNLLLAAGVTNSSIVATPKFQDDGTPKLDELGQAVMRICMNCSDAEGVNEGLNSAKHTTQKTTSHEATALHYLAEERSHPHHPIRLAKHDISCAFKLIGLVRKWFGLFASETAGFTAVYGVMVFGSKVSPGSYDVLGDLIVPAMLLEERNNPEINGATHPQVARFVDDYLSVTAMVGDRGQDHLSRMRKLIRSLFGEDGLNHEKDEVSGQLSSLKRAFGVVIDAVERVYKSQWSKVIKAYNLLEPFMESKVDSLTQNETEVARGILHHVLTTARGFQRLVLPRLDRGLASFTPEGGQAGRGDGPAKFNFIGETPEQGTAMLRFELRLVFALANVKNGKLLECSPETLLPKAVRLSWPGREGPEDLIEFLMDSSGESLFVIDLSNGDYISIVFTDEEKQLFNAFHLGDEATNINLTELWSEAAAVVFCGPNHPLKILSQINDNAAAEAWTEKGKHRHARVEQVLVLIALSEMMFKQSVMGARVNSKDNFADVPTRADRAGEFEEGLRKLGRDYKWKNPMGQKIEVEAWFRDFGMDSAKHEGLTPRWLDLVKGFIARTERLHPGLIEKSCGASPVDFGEALDQAEGKVALRRPAAEEDLDEIADSDARKRLTAEVGMTENLYWRKLGKLCEQRGKERGEKEFLEWISREHGVKQESPASAIKEALQSRFGEVFSELAVPNEEYDADFVRPEVDTSREEPTWKPPAGHRLIGPPNVWSLYTGVCPYGEAAEKSAGKIVLTGERQDRLRDHLTAQHPQAKHLAEVAEAQEPAFRRWVAEAPKGRRPEIFTASPSCIAFSAANQHARKTDDPQLGNQFVELADLVAEYLPPVFTFECTVGILTPGKKGRETAYEQCQTRLPGYHIQVLEVDAGRTTSPFTGQLSALRHIRAHVVGFLKETFPDEPPLTANESTPRDSFTAELDFPQEAAEQRRMPTEEQRSLVFKHRRKEQGASYIGHLYNPTEPLGKSRGHHNFVNEVVDPQKGRAPPFTGVGGGLWISQEFNGKADIRLLNNREGARLYCLRGVPEECQEDRSYLGQSVIGNAIPMNVSDDIYLQLLLAYTEVQADGLTAQEKWQAKQDPAPEQLCENCGKTWTCKLDPPQLHQLCKTCSRSPTDRPVRVGGKASKGPGCRKELHFTPELRKEIDREVDRVFRNGKAPDTMVAYERAVRHWKHVAQENDWDPDLTEVVAADPPEAARRVLTWLAYEKVAFGIKGSSMRGKISGVRWWHLKRRKADPFAQLQPVGEWLKDLGKMDTPTEPKLPVPFSLLQVIFTVLDVKLHEHDTLATKTALLVGYWWLLRASEYLEGDKGGFDPNRALTWDDILAKVEGVEGWRSATLPQALKAYQEGKLVTLSLRLFSDKGCRRTCTRSLTGLNGDKDCPVWHLLKLHESAETLRGGQPAAKGKAVFALAKEGTTLTRKKISDLLKEGAAAGGIPKARVASHSLRRGGASAYVASGASDAAIQRFGRWTSDAYKLYVYPHAAEMHAALKRAIKKVPHFEMN